MLQVRWMRRVAVLSVAVFILLAIASVSLPDPNAKHAVPRHASSNADVDLKQKQLLDFIHGELPNMKGQFGGSLTTHFDPKAAFKRVHSHALQISKQYNREDIAELCRRARANLIAHSLLFEKSELLDKLSLDETTKDIVKTELKSIVGSVTSNLYPWLEWKDIQTAVKTFQSVDPAKEAGIILSVGKSYFPLAIHAIRTLREVLNCSLPIEIHHAGPELTSQMIDIFNTMRNVSTVDLYEHFPETFHDNFAGFYSKPFALLASSFRKPIIMDADVLFLQDPARAILNASSSFHQHGQTFFRDRTLTNQFFESWFAYYPLMVARKFGYRVPSPAVRWFRALDQYPSLYALSSESRYLMARSHHEMESGVVALDKGRPDVLHALLLVCKLNSRLERDAVLAQYTNGDKETFWMAWELLRVPYEFNPGFSGMIGYSGGNMWLTKEHTCGQLVHADQDLQPLWWNGGILKDKFVSRRNVFPFEKYAIDSEGYMEGWDWTWKWSLKPEHAHVLGLGWTGQSACFRPRNVGKDLRDLSESQKEMTVKYTDMYFEILDWFETLGKS
ncbi:hypothetical protein HDU81_004427 [Chytriomyces hyalinus]|nr:hypothetical protein HDU81_004427 [Chytriomyces hyalinus]